MEPTTGDWMPLYQPTKPPEDEPRWEGKGLAMAATVSLRLSHSRDNRVTDDRVATKKERS